MERIGEQNINQEKTQAEKAIEGVFLYMRNLFRDFYGIKLNNIELVGLKKICAQVYSEYIESDKRLDCLAETEDRFLREFFDMSLENRILMLKTNEEVKGYFRIKHEQKNLL